MRTITTRVLLTITLAGLAVLGASALYAARAITLCFEAEAASQVSGKVWRVEKKVEDPSGKVSGQKWLGVPRMAPGQHPERDEVTYKVAIPETGTYYLWARTYWLNGCGNSFFVKIDGYDSGDWFMGGDATYNSLHWVCLTDGGRNSATPRPLQLKKGTVTITVGARESGTKIDQFVLTTDRKMWPANFYKPTLNVLVEEKPDPKKSDK